MIKFIFGENYYDNYHKLDEVIKTYQKDLTINVKVIDGSEISSLSEIFSGTESLSLFNTNTVTIVKRLFKNKSKTILEEAAKSIENYANNEIVFWEESQPDKRTALYKRLIKVADVTENKILKPADLKKWLLTKFKSNGVEIDFDLCDYLILRLNSDQSILAVESEKLILFLKSENKTQLTRQIIDSMVIATAEDNVWSFLDAMTKGDIRVSLSMLNNLLKEVSDYQIILALIASQLRVLYQIKAAGRSSAEEISRNTGIHVFRIRKLMSFAMSLEMKKIVEYFDKLVNLDLKVKRGILDPVMGLNLFVLTFGR